MADLEAYDFDVASASAKGYFELYASPEGLATLTREGIPYEILGTIDTTDAPPSEYTEYDELVPILQNLASTYPNICKLYDVGDTWENREIWALKISDNVATHEAAEKDILIDGNHHANEIMTVEVPLHLAKTMCEKYPGDPEVKLVVDNVETWIIPMLNPDGHNHVFKVYNRWRKNRRDNGGGEYGVDLNRNYDYKWGGPGSSGNPRSNVYRGPNAFSEPELKAIRDLINDDNHQFKYTLNYHASGEAMLYPWAYTYGHPAEPDYTYYKNLAEYLLATLPGWEHGNDWEILRYLASGNAVDWEYDGAGHAKDWGFTFEVDTSQQPPASQIPITCAQQYPVLLKLLKLGVCELPVKVTSFDARAIPAGLSLRWTVADHRDVAGFNLYRRPVAEGPAVADYAKLNASLIIGRSPYTFADRGVQAGRDYEYLLEGIDLSGGNSTFGPIKAKASGNSLPRAATLYQNRPNPARGTTTIAFALASPGEVALEVFDAAGRKVATPYEGAAAAGDNEITGETLSRRLVAAP
jgi:hypothetical protein